MAGVFQRLRELNLIRLAQDIYKIWKDMVSYRGHSAATSSQYFNVGMARERQGTTLRHVAERPLYREEHRRDGPYQESG